MFFIYRLLLHLYPELRCVSPRPAFQLAISQSLMRTKALFQPCPSQKLLEKVADLSWRKHFSPPAPSRLLVKFIKMNKYLLLGFSLLIFCTVAQGLVCTVCKFKVGSVCFSSDEPCRTKEGQQCETTKVYTGSLMLFTKHDCGKMVELCNKTEQRDNVFDMNYNRTCCNFDLCNGGMVSQPSLTLCAGLSLALGWWITH